MMDLNSGQNDPDNQKNQNNNQEQQAANAAKRRHQKSKNKFKNYRKKQAHNTEEAIANPAVGITKLAITAVEHPIQTIKLLFRLAIIHMIIVLVPILLLVALLFFIVMFFTTEDDNQCGSPSSSNDDSDNSTTQISGSARGAWTQKGTKAYNLNKSIFQAAKEAGFNDNGAAGIVGCASNEGSGNINTQGTLNYGENDGSGLDGEGIFQFTGGTKQSYYAWCSKNHKSPWSSVMTELKGLMGIKGTPPKNPDSPSKGAENWYGTCEDAPSTWPSHAQPRVANAQKAYQMWKGLGGESDDDSSTASAGASACASTTSNQGSADGTGSIKEKGNPNNTWGPNNIPSDMKPYIHNPEDVGMGWKNPKGWLYPGDQCADFAPSYFHLIWQTKGGPHPQGNGNQCADNFHNYMHNGTLNGTPHAGSIGSSDSTSLTTDTSLGHTFVVEHVLANGDYIVAEENWPGASGYGNHTTDDWNYAVFPKGISSTKYFMPSGSPHWSK